MRIFTNDEKRILEVGNDGTLYCFYSTVVVNLKKSLNKYEEAIKFLKDGECRPEDAMKAARQLNLIRDELSGIGTDKIVYDVANPKAKAPWGNNISPVVTSCGNFFLTCEGKDLIFEIISILVYANITNTGVTIQL